MNQERIFQVLLSPHVSEKASVVADKNEQYVFKVARDASKREIKIAVEQLFDVKVEAVQTLNVKGKKKVFGRVQGKRSDWKKAYVSLQAGQDIDFLAAE
ncbi:MAG: 50S ribosomal protein L23 [Alcanivorax sp.]|jgi:large subunit ribosomal protein L23|uniref:50S ribosomal protein L23 n=1 Tax=Alcanivorax limicola TaxID=2874102 RepID=UPI001CC03227|nr:50S ribosomal protein L23 [Alcanivorax limicola]MBZ2190450.1 50S ribosomal protein L23 [Alcanivorax limicola]MCH8544826.1 50S ribosomal protein L23 [Alcanivorax sp.]